MADSTGSPAPGGHGHAQANQTHAGQTHAGQINAGRRVRTLFLSDLHLGAHGCQAAALLTFLEHCDANRIYLVGDIVDGLRLQARWYWPRSHAAVLACLLAKHRRGTELIYIPGNHDDFMRASAGGTWSGIAVREQAIHETADGRRHLVIHGDQFDSVNEKVERLQAMGVWVYAALVVSSDAGLSVWRGLRRAAGRTKKRRRHQFEQNAVAAARLHGAEGVICGHVHRPAIRELGGVAYINTGDWIESRTAVIEHEDGRLEMLRLPPAPRFSRHHASPPLLTRSRAWFGQVRARFAG